MEQVWISRDGGPDPWKPARGPSPHPGDVTAAVKASGINFAGLTDGNCRTAFEVR